MLEELESPLRVNMKQRVSSYFMKKMCCCVKKQKKAKYHDEKVEDYDSGESGTEFAIPLVELSKDDQKRRVEFLWNRTIQKAKGAGHILSKFTELNKRIYIYGSTSKAMLNEEKEKREQEL